MKQVWWRSEGGSGVLDVLHLRCWLDIHVPGKQLDSSLESRGEVVGRTMVFEAKGGRGQQGRECKY